MIFSKKEIIIAYTVEKCNLCKKQNKRKFKEGDILFSKCDSCQCGGVFEIDMIYGQAL